MNQKTDEYRQVNRQKYSKNGKKIDRGQQVTRFNDRIEQKKEGKKGKKRKKYEIIEEIVDEGIVGDT